MGREGYLCSKSTTRKSTDYFSGFTNLWTLTYYEVVFSGVQGRVEYDSQSLSFFGSGALYGLILDLGLLKII